jgi:hypothetical protein
MLCRFYALAIFATMFLLMAAYGMGFYCLLLVPPGIWSAVIYVRRTREILNRRRRPRA